MSRRSGAGAITRHRECLVTPVPTGRDVVRRTLARPPTLGDGRLVCIDGPAGSGKTTLAAAVRDVAPSGVSCRVLHMDDVYPGWSGLAEGVAAMADGVVGALAEGTTGRYRRYDWLEGRLAEEVEVTAADLLVVEGVGSGARGHAGWITTLVWTDAPREVRLARGLARDGEALRGEWLEWMRQEEQRFATDGTRERADLVVWTGGSAAQPAQEPVDPTA